MNYIHSSKQSPPTAVLVDRPAIHTWDLPTFLNNSLQGEVRKGPSDRCYRDILLKMCHQLLGCGDCQGGLSQNREDDLLLVCRSSLVVAELGLGEVLGLVIGHRVQDGASEEIFVWPGSDFAFFALSSFSTGSIPARRNAPGELPG